jgi:hypothetical protein
VHFFRGEPMVKNDNDVSSEDIGTCNLVLFGDPSAMASISGLPIGAPAGALTGSWSATKFDANHAPVLSSPIR